MQTPGQEIEQGIANFNSSSHLIDIYLLSNNADSWTRNVQIEQGIANFNSSSHLIDIHLLNARTSLSI